MNNKGADQTARMRRLVCAFVVRKPPKTGFLATRPKCELYHCRCLKKYFILPCILSVMAITYVHFNLKANSKPMRRVSKPKSLVMLYAQNQSKPERIRTQTIDPDDYLQKVREQGVLSDNVSLRKLLELHSNNVTGSYVISLSSEEQMMLRTSQAAFQLNVFVEAKLKDKALVLENFLKMVNIFIPCKHAKKNRATIGPPANAIQMTLILKYLINIHPTRYLTYDILSLSNDH